MSEGQKMSLCLRIMCSLLFLGVKRSYYERGGDSQHTKGFEMPIMVHAILWWRVGETASYSGDFDHPGKEQLKQGQGSRARDILKGFLNPGKGW